MYIVSLLGELLKKYPRLKIKLILTDSFVDLIEERIDVAIRLGTLPHSNYIAKELADMNFYICASPDYIKQFGNPSKPSELKNHNCLWFSRAGYSNNWLFKKANQKITRVAVNGNCSITNSEAIKHSTVSGLGLSLLPDWLIHQDIKNKSLVKLFKPYHVTASDYDSAIWMRYPDCNYVPLKTRVFMDYLILNFK